VIDISLPRSGEVEPAPINAVGRRLKPNMTGLVGRNRWWVPKTYKLEDATAWLRAQLASGMRPGAEIMAEAKKKGFSYMTLRRAKKEAKIRTEEIPRGRLGKWFWSLPEQENTDGR
jgi:hypothetical protein